MTKRAKDVIAFFQSVVSLFGYESKEERQFRLRQEEDLRKHREAERMMIDLSARYQDMTTRAILDELTKMHEFCRVALWPDRGMTFYHIASDLSMRAPLSDEETARLVSMLSWREYCEFLDRGAPLCFLFAIEKNPSRGYAPALREHLAWLEQLYQPEISGTHFGADVGTEIKITRELLKRCGN